MEIDALRNSVIEYTYCCRKTILPQCKTPEYLALGLASEAGEVAGLVKKFLRADTEELDLSLMEKEVGDVMWYLAMLCDNLGLDLGAAMQKNIEKLEKRKSEGKIQGNGDLR